jgi:hypothetical protein
VFRCPTQLTDTNIIIANTSTHVYIQ